MGCLCMPTLWHIPKYCSALCMGQLASILASNKVNKKNRRQAWSVAHLPDAASFKDFFGRAGGTRTLTRVSPKRILSSLLAVHPRVSMYIEANKLGTSTALLFVLVHWRSSTLGSDVGSKLQDCLTMVDGTNNSTGNPPSKRGTSSQTLNSSALLGAVQRVTLSER